MSKSFVDRRVVVVGRSSGLGREAAADVVAGGGSAVVVGRNKTKVDDTVRALSETGTTWATLLTSPTGTRWPATVRLSKQVPEQDFQTTINVVENSPVTRQLQFAWSVRTDIANGPGELTASATTLS